MKVLHFFKTYWPDSFGGVERTIHAIAESTAGHGVETQVLSLSRAPVENTRRVGGHMAVKARLDFELASTGFSRDVFRKFDTQRSRDVQWQGQLLLPLREQAFAGRPSSCSCNF